MDSSKSTCLKVVIAISMVGSLFQKTKGQSSCTGETDRFINGTCYTFYNESITWQRAKIKCEERGQVFASIDSKMQIEKMLSKLKTTPQVWIGASDIANEGTFVWVYNNQLAVELNRTWRANEPNDYGDNEDCVVVTFSSETNDAPCYFNYTYFCMERPIKDNFTNTTKSTTFTSSTTTSTISTTLTTAAVITTIEAAEPFLSQQNIYIIAAAGAAFVLVLAIACIIIYRRKGKRMKAIKRHHVYDPFPHEIHDTVAYTSEEYAALNFQQTPDEINSPPLKEENQYDYIGGETPTEQDRRFYANLATPSETFHQTRIK